MTAGGLLVSQFIGAPARHLWTVRQQPEFLFQTRPSLSVMSPSVHCPSGQRVSSGEFGHAREWASLTLSGRAVRSQATIQSQLSSQCRQGLEVRF
jgi:hypothetical protein